MKINKTLLFCLVISAVVSGLVLMKQVKPPIWPDMFDTDDLSNITVDQPFWGSQGLIVVFVDTILYPPDELANRLATAGMTVAIVDINQVIDHFDPNNGSCLDQRFIEKTVAAVAEQVTLPIGEHRIIAGVGFGALIPLINAQTPSAKSYSNLSVGFSIELPTDFSLCPPFLIKNQEQHHHLDSLLPISNNWRSVWTDHPDNATAIFIKTLGNVDTRIAPYDTPLETVLVDELNTLLGQANPVTPPMPVVEVPAAQRSSTVTLFYSGDGGWRDLDRTVAEEMAALNYPVVGVDMLRYFWEHKTPEQAAADLSKTMAYYRKKWDTKTFVLAGYSFGADIIPAVYNRLPAPDKESVLQLVLLALAKTADFEIHISGWLGQSAGEQPLSPELTQIPKAKILCIYGKEEKAETACLDLLNTDAKILELPGAHHFDQDYPKLTRQILDVYRQHGIN